MTIDSKLDNNLFEGLRALAESAFPKQCNNCGRRYESLEAYLTETGDLGQRSGLKASLDDDDHPLIELYRNCACGSTLMDFFADRRDTSEPGLLSREHFGTLVVKLEVMGIPAAEAKEELLKLMRGQRSPRLEAMGLRIESASLLHPRD